MRWQIVTSWFQNKYLVTRLPLSFPGIANNTVKFYTLHALHWVMNTLSGKCPNCTYVLSGFVQLLGFPWQLKRSWSRITMTVLSAGILWAQQESLHVAISFTSMSKTAAVSLPLGWSHFSRLLINVVARSSELWLYKSYNLWAVSRGI